MARGRGSEVIEWYSPDPRAILPLDGFKMSRSLRQRIAKGEFEIRHDTAFERVMRYCAEPRTVQRETWINEAMVEAYAALNELGVAHSVEAWREGELVGGLYGLALGGAFCGESMFHRPERGGTDASKVCLAHLVSHLRERGFALLDVQLQSDHMAQFGVIEISREEYLRRLEEALGMEVVF